MRAGEPSTLCANWSGSPYQLARSAAGGAPAGLLLRRLVRNCRSELAEIVFRRDAELLLYLKTTYGNREGLISHQP